MSSGAVEARAAIKPPDILLSLDSITQLAVTLQHRPQTTCANGLPPPDLRKPQPRLGGGPFSLADMRELAKGTMPTITTPLPKEYENLKRDSKKRTPAPKSTTELEVPAPKRHRLKGKTPSASVAWYVAEKPAKPTPKSTKSPKSTPAAVYM